MYIVTINQQVVFICLTTPPTLASDHRYLIGTRGVTMRQIQHDSGSRIFFPTTRKTPPWAEPSGPDCITIVGKGSYHLVSHLSYFLHDVLCALRLAYGLHAIVRQTQPVLMLIYCPCVFCPCFCCQAPRLLQPEPSN